MVIVFSYIGDMDKQKLRNEVLSRYKQICQSTTDVCLYYDNGAPRLDNGKHISISHTPYINGGRIELIAISDSPIGIDVEYGGRQVAYDVANRYFTSKEIEYIGDDNARFLEIWQKREAYGKSQGVGLYRDNIMYVKDFKKYQLFGGYNVVIYTKDDDIFFDAM